MARKITDTTTASAGIDTNVFNPIAEISITPLRASFTSVSYKVAGIVKISNMFTKLLLTKKGTNVLNKQEGTYFSNIFNSNMYDGEAIFSKIQDAVDDAVDQIMQTQAIRGAPLSEKLVSATISSFTLTDDNRNFDVSVKLTFASGDQTSIELPSTLNE